MDIDDKLIAYLEELSRLALTDEEKRGAKTDLAGIIGYMAKLGELDTEGLPATSHPFAAVNRFRDDAVVQSYEPALILANAPVKTEEYFKAPKIME